MLSTILVTIGAFACLMTMMAIGVILQGKRLAGSCGGESDSKNCRCGPEKQAKCKSRGAREDEEEPEIPPSLKSGLLSPPGEERLIQLRNNSDAEHV